MLQFFMPPLGRQEGVYEMERKVKKNIRSLQGFYLLAFFGFASLSALLSVYLSNIEHLSGTKIGTLLSIGPIIMIFFQPIWGMVSDATHSPAKILAVTTALAGVFALGYLIFHQYSFLILTATVIAVFQSAIIPVSDSVSIQYAIKHKYNYGNIRLFGSLGYGLAVFLMGRLSEYKPSVIFYAFFISLLLASFMAIRFPIGAKSEKVKLGSSIKDLFKIKRFTVFLLVTFLIFGPNLANNFYFGLFVDRLGGSYTGIGVAFLIAVLSEIPFMRLSGRWIKTLGLLEVSAIAVVVSLLRWILYSLEPSLTIVYASAFIQGLSLGLFIPAGLQYIRDITPKHITATAVTIYSAIGNGLGNWFCTFLGGIIYDKYSIYTIYLFFAILAFIGAILNIWLLKEEKGRLFVKNVAKG
jgi:MFS transporter, PPP family, 3-phenylpropionic acid transporter